MVEATNINDVEMTEVNDQIEFNVISLSWLPIIIPFKIISTLQNEEMILDSQPAVI